MTVRLSRALAAFAIPLTLAGPFIRSSQAQAGQPIYPVYDGFIKNPDGTLTLSFAYFSHNSKPVTILPGPENSWMPAPENRDQPMTFLPGHHRFQCIMVVRSDFEGDIRWHLSYAGTSASTSADMLQYNWELDAGAARQARRDIDPAAAPRRVCLNRRPTVRFLGLRGSGGRPPEVSVSLHEELQLFGSVRDEGLPRGGTLVSTWRQISGPGTVTFEDTKQPRTHATFSAPGTYELELWASDSERDASARLTVIVNPAR